MFAFILCTIYEVNGTPQYLEKWSPDTKNDAIIAVLLQHQEDNFSKLTDRNRPEIDRNKFVPNKGYISSPREAQLALALQWLEEDKVKNMEKK